MTCHRLFMVRNRPILSSHGRRSNRSWEIFLARLSAFQPRRLSPSRASLASPVPVPVHRPRPRRASALPSPVPASISASPGAAMHQRPMMHVNGATGGCGLSLRCWLGPVSDFGSCWDAATACSHSSGAGGAVRLSSARGTRSTPHEEARSFARAAPQCSAPRGVAVACIVGRLGSCSSLGLWQSEVIHIRLLML